MASSSATGIFSRISSYLKRLEGVIVSCGATIEWLKNELNLFSDSKETEAMANAVADNGAPILFLHSAGWARPIGKWKEKRLYQE